MRIYGINVDPLNPNGRPAPAVLHRLGVNWIRLVLRNDAELKSYVAAAHDWDLKVLGVVARESAGFLGVPCEMYQIGNEPDSDGPSSWTRTTDEYIEDWRIYRDTYPDLPMVVAGLASGNLTYWQTIAPHLHGCAGVSVHPYNKTASQAQTLLTAYRKVRPDLALWVTEWFREANQVVPFSRMLNTQADAAFWFCATDGMVPGMGLLGTDREQMWKAA